MPLFILKPNLLPKYVSAKEIIIRAEHLNPDLRYHEIGKQITMWREKRARGTRKWLLIGTGISIVYTAAAMLASLSPWFLVGTGAIAPALGAARFWLGGEWKNIRDKTRSLFFRGITRGKEKLLPSGEEKRVPFNYIVSSKYQKHYRKKYGVPITYESLKALNAAGFTTYLVDRNENIRLKKATPWEKFLKAVPLWPFKRARGELETVLRALEASKPTASRKKV